MILKRKQNLIIINTVQGEYSYDPNTDSVFKDSKLLTEGEAEPVFSTNTGSLIFSGIYLKGVNKIISLSGKLNPLTMNENSIK